MARVTLDLGEPTGFRPGSWVQWDERTQGLGDLSAFSAVEGETRHLIRLRIFDRAANNIQFQLTETPDGSAGWAGSPDDLSDAWEQHSAAITVRAAGLDDLVITGPDAAASGDRDATEWYLWSSGNDPTSWFAAYEQAGRPAVTILVDDGQAVAVALGLAGRAAAAPIIRGGLQVAVLAALGLAGRAAAAAAVRGGLKAADLTALHLAGRVLAAPAVRGAAELAPALEPAARPSAPAVRAPARDTDRVVRPSLRWGARGVTINEVLGRLAGGRGGDPPGLDDADAGLRGAGLKSVKVWEGEWDAVASPKRVSIRTPAALVSLVDLVVVDIGRTLEGRGVLPPPERRTAEPKARPTCRLEVAVTLLLKGSDVPERTAKMFDLAELALVVMVNHGLEYLAGQNLNNDKLREKGLSAFVISGFREIEIRPAEPERELPSRVDVVRQLSVRTVYPPPEC